MDSDKIIQSKILELVYNQFLDFSTQKSPDKHLSVEAILEKLKVIYPDINITIVNTQCFRLSTKGFIEPIPTIDYINCTITLLGQNAYRSQLLIEENTKEENEDRYIQASILASIATEKLADNQIKINDRTITIAVITLIIIFSQALFLIIQVSIAYSEFLIRMKR